MSLLESRRRVVPSLWDRVFRREFDEVERMFAPGFAYELFPTSYRPFFEPLPVTGLFDPGETIQYFRKIREDLLAEPASISVTDQSMGQNSLQTRFVTKGKNAQGEPYDIRHSLFLEFDPQNDKIKRGVEYLESDSMDLHLKREEGKDWTPMTGEGAPKQVEGQSSQQAATIEGKKAENGTPAATIGAAESQGQSQSQSQGGAAGGSQAAQGEPVKQASQAA